MRLIKLIIKAWNVLFRKLSYDSFQNKLPKLLENLQGLDFLVEAEAQEIGTDPLRSHGYYHSGDNFLKDLLNHLTINANDKIIDIGCGKGGAMRVMLQFPFSKVDGVEIANLLAATARNNFGTLNISAERWNVITLDASEFNDFDPYKYVYFYNPINCDTVAKVIDNLNLSLKRLSRKVIIIYNNPVCHEKVIASGQFKKTGEFPDNWGNKIFTYTNEIH